MDVSKGETVKFPQRSEITVDIDKSLPLTIFTVGYEIDGCGRNLKDLPANIQFKTVEGTSVTDLHKVQRFVDDGIKKAKCLIPLGNPNDDLEDIVSVFTPSYLSSINYRAVSHVDRTLDTNVGVGVPSEFQLEYIIRVTPVYTP
jgi:hypothetical protein